MPRRWRHSGELQKSCASSANLFAFTCGPPWAWIDGCPVLAEFDVQHRLAATYRQGRGRLHSAAHDRNGLARHDELPQINRYSFHPGEQDMIPAARIKDQELAIIAEEPGINHPSITRSRDLGARPGGNRQALFGASEAVGGPKFPDSHPAGGQWQLALGRSERDRRGQTTGVAQRREVGPAIRRPAILGRAGSRAGAGFETLFELGDQVLQIRGLSRELSRALALVGERLLGFPLPLLALVDQQRQALA